MINHHSILIKAQAGALYGELLSWGESAWWPKDSRMKYTRLTGGAPGAGTRYHQKVLAPFGPEWDVEVISATPGREVSRRFLNGMFKGVERVYIIPEGGACEVHFLMDFEVVGGLNRLLWKLVYRKKHDMSLRKILTSLKSHVEGGAGKVEVEEHPATPEEAGRRRFLQGILKK